MSFKIDAQVDAAQGTIKGSVLDARMNISHGELEYLVDYTDPEGEPQQRWFLESQLTAA